MAVTWARWFENDQKQAPLMRNYKPEKFGHRRNSPKMRRGPDFVIFGLKTGKKCMSSKEPPWSPGAGVGKKFTPKIEKLPKIIVIFSKFVQKQFLGEKKILLPLAGTSKRGEGRPFLSCRGYKTA